MRGKRDDISDFSCDNRITPAHAGKTTCSPVASKIFTDHPRACGENGRTMSPSMRWRGSPPRMRGKRGLLPSSNSQFRITPAHAGKTWRPPSPKMRRPDHPRACGENSCRPCVTNAFDGSPPRMRGKRDAGAGPQRAGRITPAHAGKTVLRTASCSRRADHPRACGENLKESLNHLPPSGSPPRMRGKP